MIARIGNGLYVLSAPRPKVLKQYLKRVRPQPVKRSWRKGVTDDGHSNSLRYRG